MPQRITSRFTSSHAAHVDRDWHVSISQKSLRAVLFLRWNLGHWIVKMHYSCKSIVQLVMIWCSKIHVSSLIWNKISNQSDNNGLDEILSTHPTGFMKSRTHWIIIQSCLLHASMGNEATGFSLIWAVQCLAIKLQPLDRKLINA